MLLEEFWVSRMSSQSGGMGIWESADAVYGHAMAVGGNNAHTFRSQSALRSGHESEGQASKRAEPRRSAGGGRRTAGKWAGSSADGDVTSV